MSEVAASKVCCLRTERKCCRGMDFRITWKAALQSEEQAEQVLEQVTHRVLLNGYVAGMHVPVQHSGVMNLLQDLGQGRERIVVMQCLDVRGL